MKNEMDLALQAAMNNQLTFERFSADIYYSLAVQLDTANLTGMASYMHKKANEERDHAKKFSDYLADRNVLPVVSAVQAPQTLGSLDPMSVGREAVDLALEHEYIVTERINTLKALAEDCEDYQTCEFLWFFLREQVEEVRTLEEWQTKFRLASGNGAAILLINQEMGA